MPRPSVSHPASLSVADSKGCEWRSNLLSKRTAELSCWTPILTHCPNRKKNERVRGYRYSLNQLQTSPTPPLTRKNVQHAWCSLYSMLLLHTVWCGNQCRDMCLAYCCATLRHLHTTGTCSRLKECNRQPSASATVHRRQCGCELAGGEEVLPDLVHYIYYHRIVKSRL